MKEYLANFWFKIGFWLAVIGWGPLWAIGCRRLLVFGLPQTKIPSALDFCSSSRSGLRQSCWALVCVR